MQRPYSWLETPILHRTLYTLITLFTVALICSSPVHAAPKKATQKPGSFISLTPIVGGLLSSASEADSRSASPLYGLKLAYEKLGTGITNTIGVEATFNYFKGKGSDSEDANGYLFRTDAIYSFSTSKVWVPFLAAGVGAMVIGKESGRAADPLLNYGLGLKYFLEDYLAWRVDARQLFVYSEVSTRNNFELSTGLTYIFGKERTKPVPTDSKKDEIPQFKMKQVEAPEVTAPKLDPTLEYSFLEQLGAVGPAIVGITSVPSAFQPTPMPQVALPAPEQPEALAFKTPPPAPKPVPKPVPAPPAVVPPAPVVPAEPAAPAAQPEVQATIPKPRVMVRTKLHEFIVEFDFAKHDIRPEYQSRIKHAAELIIKSSNPVVTIEGHTDIVGKHSANLALSLRRASSVKAELVRYGVDQRRIIIRGHSFDRPVATNKTDTGRQRNRRATTIVTAILDELVSPVPGENQQLQESEPTEQLVIPAKRQAGEPVKAPAGRQVKQPAKQQVKQPVKTQGKQPAKKQAKQPAAKQAKPGRQPAQQTLGE